VCLQKIFRQSNEVSWDQLGGIQLNRLLVSYPARVQLGWQLTLGGVDVGHSCSSKRQDRGDRKESSEAPLRLYWQCARSLAGTTPFPHCKPICAVPSRQSLNRRRTVIPELAPYFYMRGRQRGFSRRQSQSSLRLSAFPFFPDVPRSSCDF
jgi:hypothetical protein